MFLSLPIAGEGGQFHLIGLEIIHIGKQLRRKVRPGRRRVQNHSLAHGLGGLGGKHHGLQGDFQLEKHNAAVLQHTGVFLYIGNIHLAVGPGIHHNAVAALTIHADKRRAGAHVLAALDSGHVHPGRGQAVQQDAAWFVSTHSAQHNHLSAQTPGSAGLVGPFAAGDKVKASGEDGLAQAGHGRDLDNMVHVQASDDGNFFHRSNSLLGIV